MPMAVTYMNFGGRIVAENRGGIYKEYVRDTLGNTIALIDENQNVTDTWTYWPYGEVRTRTGTTATPFGFVGALGYYTGDTGLLYVRARFLVAQAARWLTVDPFWPTLRGYSYCENQPLSYWDPFGLQSLVGPSKPSVWPILFPPDDVFFKYGNYCGEKNFDFRPCGVRRTPLDCIDQACSAHDDCLRYVDYWGLSGAACNCTLLAKAAFCATTGCLPDHTAMGYGFGGLAACASAAETIETAFAGICPLSGLTGVIDGVIDGVNSFFNGISGIINSMNGPLDPEPV
jgi:RHS repeat-associated protein